MGEVVSTGLVRECAHPEQPWVRDVGRCDTFVQSVSFCSFSSDEELNSKRHLNVSLIIILIECPTRCISVICSIDLDLYLVIATLCFGLEVGTFIVFKNLMT